jgi:hypothetical protein
MATFEGTFYLSHFIGAREVMCEDENGEQELCLAIPIDRNGLVKATRGNGGWMTFGFVQEVDESRQGFTHQVKQKTNPAHMQWLASKGLNVPIIGRLKPTKFYHRKRVRPTGVRVDKID